MPFWLSTVALLARIAPAALAAIFFIAAELPVRGPEALYTQLVSGMPATVVERSGLAMISCSGAGDWGGVDRV